MADYFDYDEIYGTYGQENFIYDPNEARKEEKDYGTSQLKVDQQDLRKQIRNSIEKLTSLRLRVSAELLSNEVIAAQIGVAIDSLHEIMKLVEGERSRAYRLVPVQIRSTDDKILKLDEEIKELDEFTFLNGVNHTYDLQKLGIMKRALDDLREYRKLLEGDIKKKYTGHPSYKSNLDDAVILEKFKRLGSYRAVGKALGCDPKTVKNRLVSMGFKKE